MNNQITSFICAIVAVMATAISFSEVTTVPAHDYDRGGATVRVA